MRSSDIKLLFVHYATLFGKRKGLELLADRIARKVLSQKLYEGLIRITWGRTAKLNKEINQVLPLIYSDEDIKWFLSRYASKLKQKHNAALDICNHIFDFLGTGPRCWGTAIDWHQDIKSGYKWPLGFYTSHKVMCNKGVDIKIPWELSRFHHLVLLAQAWRIFGEKYFADECFKEWADWLNTNPWCYGINWTCAMEAAIRSINWLWTLCLLTDVPDLEREIKEKIYKSLLEHGLYIEHNLEVSVKEGQLLGANHLLADIAGLTCLGILCPELPEAQRWQSIGSKYLEQEIQRQVLADGFFFESSTAYHRLATELFLIPALVVRMTGHGMSAQYWSYIERMMEVIYYLIRPDGNVPQIGDNDDGRFLILSDYPIWARHDYRYLLALGAVLFKRGDFKAEADDCSETIFWLMGRKGVEEFDATEPSSNPMRFRAFPDAGMYVMSRRDRGDYVLLRSGLGEHHVPTAHCHNDFLSIELWVDGSPVFIDPGTLSYTSDLTERNRLRSTVMHNAVMIGGVEINKISVDQPFFMERSSFVRVHRWSAANDGGLIEAERITEMGTHGQAKHKRTVIYKTDDQNIFIIEDEIKPADRASLFWQMPFENTRLINEEKKKIVIETQTAMVTIISDIPFKTILQHTYFASSYGCKMSGYTLCQTLDNASKAVITTYIRRKPGHCPIDLETDVGGRVCMV